MKGCVHWMILTSDSCLAFSTLEPNCTNVILFHGFFRKYD